MYQSIPLINGKEAVFKCAKCSKSKTIDLSGRMQRVRTSSTKLNVKCICGHQYKAVLENRAAIRKLVDLPGTYKTCDGQPSQKGGGMRVVNLSSSGLQLKLSQSKFRIKHHDLSSITADGDSRIETFSFENQQLSVGDTIHVEFFLNDPKRTFLSREAIIRWIKNDHAGAQWINVGIYDPSLRFYLIDLPDDCA